MILRRQSNHTRHGPGGRDAVEAAPCGLNGRPGACVMYRIAVTAVGPTAAWAGGGPTPATKTCAMGCGARDTPEAHAPMFRARSRPWREGSSVRLAMRVAGLLLICCAAQLPASRVEPIRLVIEAEACRDMSYPWQPSVMNEASGGLCLSLPEGAGSREAFEFEAEGRARFPLAIDREADYEIWLRVYWHGNCSNSLFIAFEGHPLMRFLPGVNSQTMQRWHWVRAAKGHLREGAQRLTLINREDGVCVDQICLQTASMPPPREDALPTSASVALPDSCTPSATHMITAGDSGVEALPPTEFLLQHRVERQYSMPTVPILVVTPGTRTPLDLWVRVNRSAGIPATCSLEMDGPLSIGPDGRTATFAENDKRWQRRRFTLRAHPDLPRGFTPLRCRLLTADGYEQVSEALLLRPYRWEVSQPFRLNPKAGIDQGLTPEQATQPATDAGESRVAWHPVQPDQLTTFGLINLRQAVTDRNYSMAYAKTEVSWPTSEVACLDLVHDDWIQVWLNGKLVYQSTVSAPATLTRRLVRVPVREGANALLVKSFQLKNYWEFSAVLRPLGATSVGPANVWEGE